MHRILQTLLMSLLLPALAFLGIVFYEIFSKEELDDPPYATRLSARARKGKPPLKHHH